MVFTPRNEEGRREKQLWDAVRSSVQPFHGGAKPGRRWKAAEVLPYFSAEGGRRGRVDQKAELAHMVVGPTGPEAEKSPFGIKIRFFNLQRLWKFVQGDLGRIVMWGFFLNSSRILKDFRKI
jgi:hypothetical protein